MPIHAVPLVFPADCNVVAGQSHFIKTVEDVAEIVVTTVPGAKFGLAFSEASGPCLVRTEGNDDELVQAATAMALAVSSGHTFYLVLRGAYPINVLPAIKACPETCQVFCATANPVSLLVHQEGEGRGVIGVIDGSSPKGVEGPDDKTARREFLRKIGYKR